MTVQTTASNSAAIEGDLEALTAGARRWAALSLTGRRELLQELSRTVEGSARDWVTVAARYKGVDPQSPLVGEEWVSGPYAVLAALGALTETLQALEAGRSPVDGFGIEPAPGGRVAVEVLPHNIFDRLLLSGFSVQVWMPPGTTAEQLRSRAGLGQLTPTSGGGIGVVLGAGNITSIPPLDVLYELLAHNRVSILKLNPVTDELLPVLQKAFAPLIRRGFLRILCGDADFGQQLIASEMIGHVHITGSAASHDSIVFGPGVEGEARKAAFQQQAAAPLLEKEMTSELGGVSPIIVVPGKWSKADLRFQAEHVATQRLHNGGYNCIAGQVLLLSSDWPQREAFLTELRSAMRRAPARSAYYPGSDRRLSDAKSHYPGAEDLGSGRLLIADAALSTGENALTVEYFAPVLAVVQLPGQGSAFLRSAITAANEHLVGTLGANILIHPATLRAAGSSFRSALAELRYGCIAVNAWTAFGFLTARATWGAFPGAGIGDVQSGIGVVHNALLLADSERTVVQGPFRPLSRSLAAREFTLTPKPLWFVGNRTQATTARRMTMFVAKPRWRALPGIFASALRG